MKRSRIGLFGARLFEEKDINKVANIAKILSEKYRDDLTPDDMRDPVLRSIINTVLHCSDLAEVTRVLDEAGLKAESRAKSAEILISDFFKNSLMILANRLRKIKGLPESENPGDAVTMVLTHAISSVQGKVSHFPAEGHIEDADALIGMVFLYFIGNQLILHLGDKGAELSISDVIARAASDLFRFFDPEKVKRVAHAGMEQYKAIIRSVDTRKNIKNYTHAVSNGVLAYVMSQDERLLDIFPRLFMTLVDSQEK